MLCEIAIFCKSDENPAELFPHEYSAWTDGGPVDYYPKSGELTRQKFTGIEQTRTVTTEGLQGPVHGYLNIQPPKYPPAKLTGYTCDHSIIAAVNGHAKLLVYAIDTVDPADYDSLPAAMQDMRRYDPIKEAVWDELSSGLVTITPAENQEQVTNMLNVWRTRFPSGSAEKFVLDLRKWGSF